MKTLYVREMMFGAYMIVCAIIGLRRNSHWGFSVYLLLQVSAVGCNVYSSCSVAASAALLGILS